jgi:hypothetical protein
MILLRCSARDVRLAFALGVTVAIALNIWFNTIAKPETIDGYLWLARLHEPAMQVGEWLGRSLLPVAGHPWSVRLAIAGAYAVLLGMWTVVLLAIIVFCRITRSVLKAGDRRAAK